jgi:hypothetical protein
VFDELPSVHCLIVSYEDEDTLQKTLEEHDIEIVLSTLSMAFPTAFETHVKLMRVCSAAVSVKRFAPSDWHLDFGRTDQYVHVPIPTHSRDTIKSYNPLLYFRSKITEAPLLNSLKMRMAESQREILEELRKQADL